MTAHSLCWAHGARSVPSLYCVCQRLYEAERRARLVLWRTIKQRHIGTPRSPGGIAVCQECRTLYPCETLTEVEATL